MRPGDCQANPGYRKSPLKPVAFKASTTSLRMPRHVLATLMSDTLPSHHCTVVSSAVAIVSVLFFEVSAAVKLETKTDQLDVGLIVCAKRDKVDAFTPAMRIRKVKLTQQRLYRESIKCQCRTNACRAAVAESKDCSELFLPIAVILTVTAAPASPLSTNRSE